jgi:NAD-dependent DNA ligase
MITKEELDKYIKAYQQGHPLISDEEYDILLEEYLKEHPESKRPFTRQKQSSNVNDIVGTLPKVYGVKEPMRPGQKVYMDWVKKLKPGDKIVIQPKFDGCSVAADLTGKEEKLFTRGDFDNGESVDVSDILETYFFNHHCRVTADDVEVRLSAIKYEAICSLENYEKCFKDKYSRPRDVVAAGITSRTRLKHPGDSTNFADMIPLRWYWSDGSQTLYDNMEAVSQVLDADDFEGIQRFIDNLLKNEATVKFENIHDFEMEWYGTYQCDGVVVSRVKSIVNNWIEIDPEYEVAIKILNIKQETKLVDINWQFGNSGHITPVAIVEPIKFGNVVVRNVGLSTFERVINMNLRYGDTVQIMYNIVPYFVGSKGDGNLPIPIPDNCPICQFKLDKSSLKQVKCTNPNCPGR